MFLIAGCVAAFIGYTSSVVWWLGGWAYSAMAWAEEVQPLAGLVIGTVGLLLAILTRTEWRPSR